MQSGRRGVVRTGYEDVGLECYGGWASNLLRGLIEYVLFLSVKIRLLESCCCKVDIDPILLLAVARSLAVAVLIESCPKG